ncbi:GCR1-dependent translation factor 1 [Ceratocystis platani]|uniref:GCR1-dependent translation factor 1 n=1 Tax=Ceratocystis fimbriata f. sp. platani TaxID=88771 RepID=A0A0F8D2I9_CERFI|nr:GCR1-dependent translation factor 1 [Ceratocystis platani]
MRLPTRESSLLLLLLPSLAAGVALTDTKASNKELGSSNELPAVGSLAETTSTGLANSPATDSTKTATSVDEKGPVDGKDGKPHNGPWVETTDSKKEKEAGAVKKPTTETPSNTVIDGKKIPESNDGVMDDKNREAPKTGTTGNDGGVSEKDKARKQEEGKTGEKAKGNPETPKEAPPLPHSEEEKILQDSGQTVEKTPATKGGVINDNTGLEVPGDLPEKVHDKPNPVPESAHKDHLDISKSTLGGATDTSPASSGSFHSFVLSFTMIMFAEIGDKTFLVAALMAMKHDRVVVFSAAFSALLVMTVLSAVLGHTVPVILPKKLTAFLASMLFFVFGARLLREGMAMSQDEGVSEELHEVERELAEKEKGGSLAAMEMGLGNRKGRFNSSGNTSNRRRPKTVFTGLSNLMNLFLSPAWIQTFIMTFLGEWGDRSQIATVAMAAGPDYWYVTVGALAGHFLCTSIAVLGGRAIAGKVSMKVVTIGGAISFLLFGIVYLYEAMSS